MVSTYLENICSDGFEGLTCLRYSTAVSVLWWPMIASKIIYGEIAIWWIMINTTHHDWHQRSTEESWSGIITCSWRARIVEGDSINALKWMLVLEARGVKGANSEHCIICPQRTMLAVIYIDYSTYSNSFCRVFNPPLYVNADHFLLPRPHLWSFASHYTERTEFFPMYHLPRPQSPHRWIPFSVRGSLEETEWWSIL
jgi:hypothetical protein